MGWNAQVRCIPHPHVESQTQGTQFKVEIYGTYFEMDLLKIHQSFIWRIIIKQRLSGTENSECKAEGESTVISGC